ncbi:MAG TPA: ferritin [Candidatus Syntrophosphaera sp.]|mgnify:FL=1|jgi:ferritin|nr:ferritin [Candidatus Cloacimonadota bacterium]OQB89560.1 MAG: Ferritin [Candidatus Cloacimonetes bacterium ADurb.Bin117]HNU54141.1 ferritin [Candidatus Syntrophosphaera sp.]MDI9524720.1 ferritin [Candidatus Cloacimonadota bacterium]NLH92881.1 ferritin [Candidatus Cloacimonadota bacterium]
MISKTLEKAINEQINKELFSEYLYISMQAWFANENLDGMASWMKAQSEEEHFHAMKFFDYLIERGGKVELMAIEKPEVDFGNPLKAFKAALEHEQFVTKSINNLMDIAISENDHASRGFLQWYVDEQVEEEASVDRIVSQLEMIGDNMHGILMLDRELSSRTFTPPEAGE